MINGLQEAVDRWLSSYNSSRSFTDETFDFELEQFLHSSSPEFLISLVYELSQQELSNKAEAFLGAGIAEELLLKNASVIGEIIEMSRKHPRFRNIFTYAWESDRMSPEAINFLMSLQ